MPDSSQARSVNESETFNVGDKTLRDRSLRPDNLQDGRNTSRSQEINANSFRRTCFFRERAGRPVIETTVIQARSFEDS